MSDAVKNPFRIPKPKDDIVFKGRCGAATEEGHQAGDMFDRLNVILTSRHLWLSAELSIPLSSIKSIELIEKDRVIQIVYRHWLEQQDETVCFFAQNFWGRGDVKKNGELIGMINKQRANMPDTPDEEAEGQIEDAVREQTGCEECGEKDGEMIHQGAFYCVGLWPICGAYWWRPQRRYLCQKHAARQYVLQCLATALGGYWGFPGIFVAPVRVCANMLAIKKAFPKTSTGALAAGFVIGMIPLFAIVCWIAIALSG